MHVILSCCVAEKHDSGVIIEMFPTGPFSLGLKNREVRKIAKLGWKLPSNCTKFHPKLRTKNRKSECDFSNFAWNFTGYFVMRTHTAEKSRFYSRDLRPSFTAPQLNVRSHRAELSERPETRAGNGAIECTGHAQFIHKLRDFFAAELKPRFFGVMRTRIVKTHEFSCRDFL